MATTKVQDGNVLNLTLATDATSGSLVVQGKIVGVAQITGLTGEVVPCEVVGVQRLQKASADDIAVGTPVYVEDGKITSADKDGVKCGYAVKAAAAGVLEIDVRLVPTC